MVGRSLDNQFPKEFGTKSAEPMLKAEHLMEAGVLRDVSFEAYGGQILGFAGLVGAGRTETMRAIFGADPLDSGKIIIKGKEDVYKRQPFTSLLMMPMFLRPGKAAPYKTPQPLRLLPLSRAKRFI